MHSLSKQSYNGSKKNHPNKSDTLIPREEDSINFNYMEIHNHEKRHLKNTERISNKEKKNDMQTMAAIFMSHLRRRSAQVWDWFCMSE